MNWQDRHRWFEDWTGVDEEDFLAHREKHIVALDDGDLAVRNVSSGELHPAGCFTVHSLAELITQASTATRSVPEKNDGPLFEIIVRSNNSEAQRCAVDVAHLQSTAESGSLFQVASNFNCAEVPSRFTELDGGRFVTNLADDHTQGPAASASAGISAITRIHAAYYDADSAPMSWGQGAHQQVELLGAAALWPHFPVTNGKLIFQGDEPTEFQVSDSLLGQVKLGLHQRAPAYFGRRVDEWMAISDPVPVIDQVFVAALNWRAKQPIQEHLLPKTAFLLRAAYEGTYLAAITQGSSRLVLTLVGGGSFANPVEQIVSAIAQAHQTWAGRSSLRLVQLPIYPIRGGIDGLPVHLMLQEALLAAGVPESRILVRHL